MKLTEINDIVREVTRRASQRDWTVTTTKDGAVVKIRVTKDGSHDFVSLGGREKRPVQVMLRNTLKTLGLSAA